MHRLHLDGRMNERRGEIIREFKRSDLDPVRALIHRTIDACYGRVYPPRAVQFFKDYHSEEKILERGGRGVILVVERNGKVIATGGLADGEISGVFVDPEFQRGGIGATLMRALEGKAAEKGSAGVELDMSLTSRGFYERLGYEILEERSIDVGEGQRLDYWRARKQLKEFSGGAVHQ